MSRFDTFLFVQALKDILGALLPILLIFVACVVVVLGWWLWLKHRERSRSSEAHIEALEERVTALEKRRKER